MLCKLGVLDEVIKPMSNRAVYALCFTALLIVGWELWTSRFIHAKDFVFIDRWRGIAFNGYAAFDNGYIDLASEADHQKRMVLYGPFSDLVPENKK